MAQRDLNPKHYYDLKYDSNRSILLLEIYYFYFHYILSKEELNLTKCMPTNNNQDYCTMFLSYCFLVFSVYNGQLVVLYP